MNKPIHLMYRKHAFHWANIRSHCKRLTKHYICQEFSPRMEVSFCNSTASPAGVSFLANYESRIHIVQYIFTSSHQVKLPALPSFEIVLFPVAESWPHGWFCIPFKHLPMSWNIKEGIICKRYKHQIRHKESNIQIHPRIKYHQI
jgi:hypothetical protein